MFIDWNVCAVPIKNIKCFVLGIVLFLHFHSSWRQNLEIFSRLCWSHTALTIFDWLKRAQEFNKSSINQGNRIHVVSNLGSPLTLRMVTPVLGSSREGADVLSKTPALRPKFQPLEGIVPKESDGQRCLLPLS